MLETDNRESSPDVDEDVNKIDSTDVLLQRGMRSLNLGDASDAVSSFARACELLAKKHGDLGYECGEAYLGYGKALLEQYRRKSNPIQATAFNDSSLITKFAKPMFAEEQYDDDIEDATKKDSEDDEDTNNDKLVAGSSSTAYKTKKDSDIACKAADEKSTEAVEDAIEKVFDGEKKIIKSYLPSKFDKLFLDEKDSEKNSENKSDKKNGEDKEKKQDSEQEDDNEENVNDSEMMTENEEVEDDVAEKDETDLEMAWEWLEVAKTIFNRSEKNDKNKNFLAEALMALGDISLENEQFGMAIEDMKKGLDLMIELHSTDYVVHRDLAESVFKLGTAYLLNYETNDAISCFNKSKHYLNDRLQEIKKDSSEHAEIIKIIEEIDDKISDAVEMKNSYFKILSSAKSEPGCSSGTSSGAGTSGKTAASSSRTVQANDITHLMKRRRPEDKDDSKSDTQPSKQFKAG